MFTVAQRWRLATKGGGGYRPSGIQKSTLIWKTSPILGCHLTLNCILASLFEEEAKGQITVWFPIPPTCTEPHTCEGIGQAKIGPENV